MLLTPIISTIIIGFHPEFGNKLIPSIFKNICGCICKNNNKNKYDRD
jgi:hypothetical protein